ncbi:alanyl-tRNA editing protein Aarsd1-like [Branchiostoma floridae]|uniref:Alanyl-tRNA editing protein Aarsd1-like n=1 Tax=Branchiostoma floridae TaxID=7739 RepID=C3XTB1_BRAFL|nr:alanyl-tRNA editing protein Aarsd1-like [Branchiostoma floridae]|eukprot:XP_002612691.1 hypothetical protein BRAFLDRAFT_127497 [Branchiostoma floridae]
MALQCQQNSYLTEFSSKVVSCNPGQLVISKKKKQPGYEVILEDTILFPEGGGQPDDRGKINDVDVIRVTRKQNQAVHFVETPLEVGSEVKMEVDWTRRFDHMQQHSGQHLITAIAEAKFGYKTTSWDLGSKVSSIEMDTPTITLEQLSELEREVNECIRRQIPMTPRLLEPGSPELEQVRSRGLPDDHIGPVRVVEIEGIDHNTCCGTHVSNLAHLQAIKLLSLEKGKKGKTNVMFVAGNRVLDFVGRAYDREKGLTGILKCPPEEHVEMADKLQKSLRISNKTCTGLLRDVAVLEAQRYKSQPNRDPVFCLHRKEGDSEFMNIIANEVGNENALVLLSVGDEKGAGTFLLSGPADVVEAVGPKVAEVLEGKGAAKRGRFQGKATKLANLKLAEEVLREHFKTQEAA